MTIAANILQRIADASAVTLACGYAVFHNPSRTVRFPTAAILSERRNATGRCTYLLAHYADDSRLEFRWSEAQGARYKLIEAKP